MPPASLSAKPLTSPGPRTARVASSRTRQIGSGGAATGRAAGGRRTPAAGGRAAVTLPAADQPGARPGRSGPVGPPGGGSAGRPASSGVYRLKTRGRRFFQAVGMTVSMRVVDGDDAHQAAVVVDDRDGEQVVVGDDLGHLVLVGEDADRDRLVDHHVADRRVRLGDDEVAQREHADEAAVVVGHVDVVDRLGVGLELAQPVDRLGGVRCSASGDVLGGHDPAGRVLGVAEQLLDLLRLVVLHEGEDLVAGVSGRGRRRGRPRRRGSSPRGCRRRAPGSRSSRTSTWVSGSISSIASATASSSREARTPARSRGASWSMIVARSAGWSSARPPCGHAQLDRRRSSVSTGSTSSQSM